MLTIDSLPGRRYMVVKQLPWLRWFTDPLRGITGYLLKHGHNFGYLLTGNLASLGKPGIYWWATEYWFGTVCWVFFLGYQSEHVVPRKGRAKLTLSSSIESTTVEYADTSQPACYPVQSVSVAKPALCAYANVTNTRHNVRALDS